jgi:hypothetical protein
MVVVVANKVAELRSQGQSVGPPLASEIELKVVSDTRSKEAAKPFKPTHKRIVGGVFVFLALVGGTVGGIAGGLSGSDSSDGAPLASGPPPSAPPFPPFATRLRTVVAVSTEQLQLNASALRSTITSTYNAQGLDGSAATVNIIQRSEITLVTPSGVTMAAAAAALRSTICGSQPVSQCDVVPVTSAAQGRRLQTAHSFEVRMSLQGDAELQTAPTVDTSAIALSLSLTQAEADAMTSTCISSRAHSTPHTLLPSLRLHSHQSGCILPSLSLCVQVICYQCRGQHRSRSRLANISGCSHHRTRQQPRSRC